MKKTSLVALLIVAAHLTGYSQESKTNQVPTAGVTNGAAASQEKPRPLTKEDGLTCSFSQDLGLSFGSNYGTSGSASATANHFKCKDKDGKEVEIELISKDSSKNAGLENGKVAIRTKDFGTVYRGNDEGTFDVYYMTDSQIKKLKKFLGF